jgi:hypothetical protein
MRKAVEKGAPAAFEIARSAFDRVRREVLSVVDGIADRNKKSPPRDEPMIVCLGKDIDNYYGTDNATSDVQLLWNSASSLAHAERWYSTLTKGPRAEVADMLTMRSLDVVCSGINVTALRVTALAAACDES